MGKLYRNAILFIFIFNYTCVSAQKSQVWTSLFDGKTLNGWKRLAGNATYQVKDGVVVGTAVMNTGNTFLVTEKEYDDFILELEVMIESETGNSGIQTRSHFDPAGNNGRGRVYGRQVEIDPSARQWTGGVYSEGTNRGWLYPMDLNPKAKTAFKAGAYNHVRIECIGNELKTWINNIPATYLIDTIDQRGFIGLQVHSISKAEDEGKKVYFKNIRIKTTGLDPRPFPQGIYVVNNISNALSDYQKKEGWKLLFDGKSGKGWRSVKGNFFPEKGWQIKDGLLSVLPAEGKEAANGGDIITKEQYSAFDLSFDFKLTPGANSGVKYFVTLAEQTTGSAIGLEYQLLDDELHPDAKLGVDGNRTLAALYDLKRSTKQSRYIRPIGQWNTGRVVVYPSDLVEYYLNGVKVLEYVRKSQEFRELVAKSKYKVWNKFGEAPRGHILLQDHGNQVSFRNIRIKTLN